MRNTCKEDGCPSPVEGRGLCSKHYQRARKAGTLEQHERIFVPREGDCEVVECDKRKFAGDYCQMHYSRWRRHGDPNVVKRMNARGGFSELDRFERYVNRTDRCWEWTGGRTDVGYGQITTESGPVYVHRWSYEHHVGPIPDGMVIDHLCSNRGCVNPAHLEAVTNEENLRRRSGANRVGPRL